MNKALRRLSQISRESVSHRIISFPPELRRAHRIDTAIKVIQKRFPEQDEVYSCDETPVFLLSAGWRSGSTLLQRLICSTGEIALWGEPLGDAALIPRMADSLIVHENRWPPAEYFADGMDLDAFAGSWIANVTPSMSYLRHAHKELIKSWLQRSAVDMFQQSNWGMKEVRLTIEHARYLKWLFPNARFIFIYRNLYDAYLSWRGNTWASSWPGYFSWSPVAYAKHWKLLLSGYLDGCDELGGFLVKFEDLVSGEVDLDALAKHVGISKIDESVLDNRIGSPDEGKLDLRKKILTPAEKFLLRLTAGRLMRRVGYL